jgi:hypothetical protein
MELCKKIDIEFDFDRLLKESIDIINEVGWHNDQISLQYSNIIDSWGDDVDHYGYTRKEHECINWNSALSGSYIKEVIESIHPNVASSRIMKLSGPSCYITHIDLYTRFQIPLILDPLKSYMIWPEYSLVASLTPGEAYYCNTHEIHNYVNGEYKDRINIIFNDANEMPYLDNPHIDRLFGNFKEEIKWK